MNSSKCKVNDCRTEGSNSPDTWTPTIKHRRRFSSNETRVLEKEYDKNTSPSQEKIQIIADSINTPRKIVTTWFQNRRAKNKRREKLRKEALNKVNTVGQITDSNDSLDSCGGNTEYAHQDGSPKVILNNTMFESLSPQYHTLSNTMYCREDLESTPFQIPQHRYMLRSNPLSYFPDNSENDNAYRYVANGYSYPNQFPYLKEHSTHPPNYIQPIFPLNIDYQDIPDPTWNMSDHWIPELPDGYNAMANHLNASPLCVNPSTLLMRYCSNDNVSKHVNGQISDID